MTLTVERVEAYVRRRLGGESSVDVMSLCNSAGRQLIASHTWEWLVRSPVTLTLSAGRTEFQLPDDFSRLVKAETDGSLLTAVQMTTPSHLLELETSVISLTDIGYWCAVIWKKESDSGELRPVLRVYPSVSTATTLRLYYYSGWKDVSGHDEAIEIPAFCEALFLEYVFAFAQGYDDHDIADVHDRVAKIQLSPLFVTAVAQDAQVQDEVGALRNGVDWDMGMYQSATYVGGPYRA